MVDLDPKDPEFGRKVYELFQAAEIGGTGGLGKKIALLTYLVENDLAPALPGTVEFHPEPVQMFALVSVYMDDPLAIGLLPAVCEYEAAKYPDDPMTAAQAKAFARPIEAKLEVDRNDPAEAEKEWQAGREWQPEAHVEREKAHRLFKAIERKARKRGVEGMQEVGKERFKEMYFRLGDGKTTGWTLDYWNEFFELEKKPGMKYLVEEPPTPEHTRMMVVADFHAREYRLFFMTEESEESFFDFPGKE